MTPRRLLTAAAVALSSVAWTPTRAALAPPPAPADTDPQSRQQWSAATVRHLLRRMRTVPTAQRERAVSALQEHVRLHGHAGLVDDVVAALVEALDDPDPHRHVPRAACDALRDLGPTARAAVPALRRRV